VNEENNERTDLKTLMNLGDDCAFLKTFRVGGQKLIIDSPTAQTPQCSELRSSSGSSSMLLIALLLTILKIETDE